MSGQRLKGPGRAEGLPFPVWLVALGAVAAELASALAAYHRDGLCSLAAAGADWPLLYYHPRPVAPDAGPVRDEAIGPERRTGPSGQERPLNGAR